MQASILARPGVGKVRSTATAPDAVASNELGGALHNRSTLGSTKISLAIIAVGVSIAIARFAEAFLVPLIIGILLSYTLRPLVSLLQQVRIPRLAAAALVIAVLVGLIGATGYALREDLGNWVAELPVAARKVRHAVADAARRAPGPVTNVKVAAEELDKAAAEASGKPAGALERHTAGVSAQVQDFVTQQSGNALGVIGEILIALLLALFLLSAGDTFRRKVARIAGASPARLRATVEVLNEIDGQIQAYMLTLLIADVLIGLAAWGTLRALGVPNAGMLGAVTGLLHIIPYAGTVLAASAVGVAAVVETGGLADAIVAMGAIAAIASAIGMGLATWLQGRAVRMNAVAVFVGVLFFGWLWGGWGLLLGVPILAVLKSIADRVPAMRPVSELLAA